MERFSADWLTIREEEDIIARDSSILECVQEHLEQATSLNILDIGSGTGATMRALFPKFKHRQIWTLLDADRKLLARSKSLNQSLVKDSTNEMHLVYFDLTKGFGYLNADYNLVTTTAFLDLVSESWIKEFVQTLKDNNLAFYCSITPTNKIVIEPKISLDDKIICAFNTHRYKDKGFGKSLGGKVTDFTINNLNNSDFQVFQANKEWGCQNPDSGFRKAFYTYLIEGIAEAVAETKLLESAKLEHWRITRLENIYNDQCEIWFEIVDFFAFPKV